jgi:hypothetical protein
MAAAMINLELEAGATFTHEFQWMQQDGTTPVDLTGVTARSQWRTSIDDLTVQEELTTENGKIYITPLLGKVVIHLTALQTSALALTSFVYDIELVYPVNLAGEVVVYRFVKGKVKVSKEVTR